MTGVQTCALPICFPVTIHGGKLNKVLLFVIMAYGEGNYSVGIGDACYNFLIGSRSKSIKVGEIART